MKSKKYIIFILLSTFFYNHTSIRAIPEKSNSGKVISKMQLIHEEITRNVKGFTIDKNKDLTEQKLRHLGLVNMIKYKRWDLLPFLGQDFFSFSKKDRQKILNLFISLQDKLKTNFDNWETFILNLPEYKLSEQNVLSIFKLIKQNDSRKCTPFILPYIAYPKSKIRKPALITLSVLKDDRAFPEILRLLKSPLALQRCYALSALYYIHDKRMKPFILEAVKDTNKTVRIYALRALAANSQYEYNYTIMNTARDDKNYEVQAYALKVIRDKRIYAAGGIVTNLIFHIRALVRRNVLTTLEKLNYRSSTNALSNQLQKEDKKDLQLNILKLISHFMNSSGAPGVAYVLNHSKFDEVRIKAAYILSLLNSRRFSNELIKALKDKNYLVVSEACWSLAKMNIRSAAKPIFKVSSNPKLNYYTRTAALYSLEKLNESSLIIPLYDLSEKWQSCLYKKQLKQTFRRMLKKRFR